MAKPTHHAFHVDYSGKPTHGLVAVAEMEHGLIARGAFEQVALKSVEARCGEFYAILYAVELAAARGMERVTIHSDCRVSLGFARRDALAKRHTASPLHVRLLVLRPRFECLTFAYIPRRENMAHYVAAGVMGAYRAQAANSEKQAKEKNEETEIILTDAAAAGAETGQ